MNKKRILIAIIILLVIVLTTFMIKPRTYKLGDSIKTHNIKLTLKDATLSKRITKGGLTDSYIPINDTEHFNGYKDAEPNHTFLSFSIYIQNISKKEINLEKVFNDKNVMVEYQGVKYYSNNSKENSKKNYYKSGYMVWQNSKNIDQFKSFNYIDFKLKPYEELNNLRIFLDLPVEVKNLKNKFYLIFELKNNNKNYLYKYEIKQERRRK